MMASIRQIPSALSLPDFCSLGVILRILIISNGLFAAGAFARQGAHASFWQDFLTVMALGQPLLLASVVILCPLRHALEKLAYPYAVAALLLVEGVLAVLAYAGIRAVLPDLGESSLETYLIACLLVSAILLVYFHLRGQALSPALTEARLQALQARIRPHFLFNSITAVLSLIRAEPARAERALEDMADLFRVLMADNRQLTPLADEVRLCRQYLDIEQLRLGARLRVAWHTDKMPSDALIPPLVLQPLVENAVYHGIEPRSAPGELNINIYRSRDQVIMVLRNPYLSEGGHHGGNKMAMENIRQRLALHFDVEASLKTQIVGDSYQVTITLPYATSQA